MTKGKYLNSQKNSNFNCPICEDTGWICENCGTRWELSSGGTCCGAGGNCNCNPNGEIEMDCVFASTNPMDVTGFIQ